MDIPRKSEARKRRIRRILLAAAGLIAIVAITVGVSKLKPAPPDQERAAVWLDVVKQGDIDRQVRGLGTLVPEEIRWIPAGIDGRVERRLALPGTPVHPDTILIELSNLDLEAALLDAERQWKAAEADLRNTQVRLRSEEIDRKAAAAQASADYSVQKAKTEMDEAMATNGLIIELTLKQSRAALEGRRLANDIQIERLKIGPESAKAQLDAQESRVEQLHAAYDLKARQVGMLKVRAGVEGVLQQLEAATEVGQRVGPGTNLARVVDPRRLKAELKIPETQAKDVAIGQPASIDTRNGIIAGRVVRIDPAAREGSVGVDVQLLEGLPKGARPDLGVEGTIELERMKNVVHVGRPAFGQERQTITLFKLEPDGKTAVRVPVKIGRMSVSTVEILDGLKPGDEVILSDMSKYDGFDAVRLR